MTQEQYSNLILVTSLLKRVLSYFARSYNRISSAKRSLVKKLFENHLIFKLLL